MAWRALARLGSLVECKVFFALGYGAPLVASLLAMSGSEGRNSRRQIENALSKTLIEFCSIYYLPKRPSL
jgi:hypothetical protein